MLGSVAIHYTKDDMEAHVIYPKVTQLVCAGAETGIYTWLLNQSSLSLHYILWQRGFDKGGLGCIKGVWEQLEKLHRKLSAERQIGI